MSTGLINKNNLSDKNSSVSPSGVWQAQISFI